MKKIFFVIFAIFLGALLGITVRMCRQRPPAEEPEVRRPRVAVVLDDWGYSEEIFKEALTIDYPLTLAVLPHLRFSRKIALDAKEAGMEVILHLPLEPASNKAKPEKGTIYRIMIDDEIRIRLTEAFDSVPDAVGVSNHMGSIATRDERVMGIILKDVKERELYFLDSLTTSRSVCGAVGEKLGVDFISRDVFLDVDLPDDDRTTYEKIYERLKELVEVAKTKGEAVGVGHAKRETLAVLRDTMPDLEKEGIEFAPLSDIIYNR